MQLVILFSLFALSSASQPLLIWSNRDVQSLDLPLGYKFGERSLIDDVIVPNCQQSQVVLFDVPNLSFRDLKSVASRDESEWPVLKTALSAAKFEKVFNYDGLASPAVLNVPSCQDRVQVRRVAVPDPSSVAQALDSAIREVLDGLVSGEDVIFVVRSESIGGKVDLHANADDSPVRRLLRRAAEDEASSNDTDSLYVSTDCALFYAEKAWLQLLGAFPGAPRLAVKSFENDGTKCNSSMVDFKIAGTVEEASGVNAFKFSAVLYSYQNSQWFVKNAKLEFEAEGEQVSSPVDWQYVAAPLQYSYACMTPQVLPNSLKDRSANLIFSNMQIQPFYNSTSVPTNFSDAADCESIFSTGMVMGFTYTVMVLLLFAYATTMFTSLKNPVFGDRNIVVAQE